MKILNETLATIQSEFEFKTAQAKKLFEGKQLLKLEVSICDDQEIYNPRDNDNIGKMICQHKRYNLGDKHKLNLKDCNNWDEVKEQIQNEAGTNAIILPLYLYDHGGITISTKPFGCRFDSGQVGFIYALRNSEGLTVERITEILESEVKEYDIYLRGEIYEYKIENQITGELVESCGGYFSEEEARDAGESELKNFIN